MRTMEQVRRIEESNYSSHVQRQVDIENGVVQPESKAEEQLLAAGEKFRNGEFTEEELQTVRDFLNR